MTEFKIVLDFWTNKSNEVMIQIALSVIIISLQINIVSQECTNTQDTMHKLIAWAQVTFYRATLLFMHGAHHCLPDSLEYQ